MFGMKTLTVLIVLTSVATANEPEWVKRGESAMVASDSPMASAIGRDILKSGGNAVDAAVATSMALAVARPYSTGLGGGSFTLLQLPDGKIMVQDARETAPAAASEDMFVRRERKSGAPQASRYGYLAVAVPGLLQGRAALHEEFGSLPWERLVQPAARLARQGFPVDKHYVKATREVNEIYNRYPEFKQRFPYVYRVHLNNGDLKKVGDTLRQPALAAFLERVAELKSEAVTEGPVANAMHQAMTSGNGIVTAQDLRNYRPRRREPFRFKFLDTEVVTMPPPSSGGIALMQILNMLEAVDYPQVVAGDAAAGAHLQVEAMRHAFADRARWLGDADFCDVPVKTLTDAAYIHELAERIHPGKTTPTKHCGTAQLHDDAGTSHFCIIDDKGMAIVSTETINTAFGSLAAVDQWGLILNNEMDDFTAEPGKPNAYGLMQSTCNAIAPGKRPLSSMTPTFVTRDGRPILMLGGSGGPRIITSTLNVMLGVLVRNEDLADAMLADRPHHQWQPDHIFFDGEPPAWSGRLTAWGHVISKVRKTGIVQAIAREGNAWVGASDPRKGGKPAGY